MDQLIVLPADLVLLENQARPDPGRPGSFARHIEVHDGNRRIIIRLIAEDRDALDVEIVRSAGKMGSYETGVIEATV